MAEEIIDLRDRIEKMRIQIENEATEQILDESPKEIHQKTNDSNISLSLKKVENEPNQIHDFDVESKHTNNNEKQANIAYKKNETFPAVSLSVKNPVSSKVLIVMIILQILSNVGILYFLYLGME
tara:strand:+ start:120 stop:494 length:375 start_codon:yes stop_codon:yes gene_type:complete